MIQFCAGTVSYWTPAQNPLKVTNWSFFIYFQILVQLYSSMPLIVKIIQLDLWNWTQNQGQLLHLTMLVKLEMIQHWHLTTPRQLLKLNTMFGLDNQLFQNNLFTFLSPFGTEDIAFLQRLWKNLFFHFEFNNFKKTFFLNWLI